MAASGVMDPDDEEDGEAAWIVLTPSIDDSAWRKAIADGADAAGLRVEAAEPGYDLDLHQDSGVVLITQDANAAIGSGSSKIVAIVPQPSSAYDVVGERYGLVAPESVWLASSLIARALALYPGHPVISGADLGKRPRSFTLFGHLKITPPTGELAKNRLPAVHTAFEIYRAANHEDLEPTNWSERIFIYDERASRKSDSWGELDTTGRPRILVYGPYLSLAPGVWRALIRFAVDQDAAKRQYRVDWGTRADCVSEYVTPGKPGVYELALDFPFQHADAAEIRLVLTEGSFNGRMIFHGATIQKLGPLEADRSQTAA